jgi:DNA-binding CsgD family transcriptional regulator
MVFIGVRHHEAAVRAVLPDELKPLPGLTGTVSVFRAAQGWGIAPYSACFMTIEVEGHDSPDGSPAYYMASGYFSDRAGVVMRRDYNSNFRDGCSRQVREGAVLRGIGGPHGTDALAIEVQLDDKAPVTVSGIHNYIGRNPRGAGLNLYSVAYTGPFFTAAPLSVDIFEAATDDMKQLRPAELLWALEVPSLSMTYSPPRLITDTTRIAQDGVRVTLLDIFSRLRQPAMVLARDGTVVFMNPPAEGLARAVGMVERGSLRLPRRDDRAAVLRLVEQAIRRDTGAFDLVPIAIERPGGRALIAQLMPIDPAVAGEAALMLLSDPGSEAGGNPTRALQLLGLTPAEARIAALVGSGLSPRETAERVGNSEGTVRSALTQIYQKLDIGRQSELARIVARLETIGT